MMKPFPAGANIQTAGPALLYINVGWCGHCKAARPVMEKVAAVLGSMVPVYDIDGDERSDLAKALGAKGYPTIVYISRGGARYTFNGERTVDAVSSFVCHNSEGNYEFCRAANAY